MFCGNCGNRLTDDSIFCGGCGAKCEVSAQQPEPAENAVINTVTENAYETQQAPEITQLPIHETPAEWNNALHPEIPQYQSDPTTKPAAKPKKKSITGSIMLIASILLLLGAVAFAEWQLSFLGIFAPSPSTQHSVTFFLNDGTSNTHGEDLIVTEGYIIYIPTPPERDGYNFLYWTMDRAGSHRYNFDSPVDNSLTLFAKWASEDLPEELFDARETDIPGSDDNPAFEDDYSDLADEVEEDAYYDIDVPALEDDRWERDFILDFSSDRAITDADLSGLSLAELRIARNEIFARHGRQFANPLLYGWFNSKHWYQAISPKFTPTQFYALRPVPLSSLEHDNVYRITAHEESVLQAGRVFPQSNSIRLTEFDIILSREVLRRGLDEIYTYAGVSVGNRDALNDVERHNAELIEYALSLSDIQF